MKIIAFVVSEKETTKLLVVNFVANILSVIISVSSIGKLII